MVDPDNENYHISQQFDQELYDIKTKMLEMGGMVQEQVNMAIKAILNVDTGLAEEVVISDQKINAMEVRIDEECEMILARRQPAARDLRLVLAISKSILDLERVGDEAVKIARQAIRLSDTTSSPKLEVELRHIGSHVSRMLVDALDAFARLDVDAALAVAKEDKIVDQEYSSAMRAMVTYVMEDPRSISEALNIMWTLRALERVGDHSRNIAEHVIYLARGEDVRHVDLETVEAFLEKDTARRGQEQ